MHVQQLQINAASWCQQRSCSMPSLLACAGIQKKPRRLGLLLLHQHLWAAAVRTHLRRCRLQC